MYAGAVKGSNGELRSWRDVEDLFELHREAYLHFSQDLDALMKRLIPVAFRRSLQQTIRRRELSPECVDWLLHHLSSFLFQQPVYDALVSCGVEIPQRRWFTNLAARENTGAAAIFIMLEELLASGRVQDGDRILCSVPESSRFTCGYIHLTAVAG